MVKHLVAHGAIVDARDVAEWVSSTCASVRLPSLPQDGWQTPLLHASANGHRDVVEVLLEHGADADGKDSDGHEGTSGD